ncbi:protein of unknown function [Saccharopolyspora antimicrobica]|uniref:Uncharacterized protein DUF397 n=1 Tax=Saccharopolyspora antimicrobica TaxID=455193 RepID=A0A1I5DHY5_9PSEU|nr:DUF397 domain-containing protein [Saccharopolyspora antimicrobica]RKT85110.1 uncharacterized protein DUF397 [Saccharopolyspora antimicrobica]SFN98832.1 protein of unknown function [Saccharopolyspora antimicrobica]
MDAVNWRKSSYSGSQSECVEVGWSKSSYSGAEGDCVEVAAGVEVVGVRDSKDPGGAVLAFPRRQWATFVSGLRDRRW